MKTLSANDVTDLIAVLIDARSQVLHLEALRNREGHPQSAATDTTVYLINDAINSLNN